MDPGERVRRYILNLRLVLDELRRRSDLPPGWGRVVDMAERYTGDAEYYLGRGDVFTALACAAYAEGLVDALRHAGVIDIEWRSLSELGARPRVLVAGSFEILHPGHIYLFREAWRLGSVHVVVARDSSIERFKGRKPVVPEEQRLRVVESVRYVSRAVLGDPVDYLKPVLDIRPDIILLGPDQWPDEERLRGELEERGLGGVEVVRLPERIDGGVYSTSGIIERVCRLACRRGSTGD